MAVRGGATMVQLRDKSGDLDAIEAYGRELLEVLKPHSVPLLINDHVEIAARINAQGAHIGQGDIDPAHAREIIGADAILGLTAFNADHFAALDAVLVDYVGTGPVYPTKTDKGKPVIGPEGLARMVGLSSVPMVGIGGITPENARDVFDAGVQGVAMMRAISGANNPEAAARAFADIAADYKIGSAA